MDEVDRLFPVPAHAALVRKVLEADGGRDAVLFASLFTDGGAFRIGRMPGRARARSCGTRK